jgi:hypothetical protein
MECVSRGETYPAETITLGFDITGCTLYRVLHNAATGVEVKNWDSDTVGEITITDAAGGVYNVPKWTVNLVGGSYVGKDKIEYANGDTEDLWNLTLTVED